MMEPPQHWDAPLPSDSNVGRFVNDEDDDDGTVKGSVLTQFKAFPSAVGSTNPPVADQVRVRSVVGGWWVPRGL